MSGQRFICGMRRFDKHRINVEDRPNQSAQSAQSDELEARLRQRDEQDRMLRGSPVSPTPVVPSVSPTPVVPSVSPTPVVPSVSPTPVSSAISSSGYTPWKTPSVSTTFP